jgi:6-phosphofructokinase
VGDALMGNALIGQAGGPTAVINESLVGIVRAAGRSGVIPRILGARHGVKGILASEFFDLRQEPEEVLDAVARTPAAALGSVRKKPTPEECSRIFEVCRANDVRYFFYIGGNDSAETAFLIRSAAHDAGHEMRLFHVPKTIDNDLLVTDHCPGFGSAARFVAHALIGDDLDNRALPGVKIDVIMGRNAGFLTAAAALARRAPDDGPHLVYLPEATFSLERFQADVRGVVARLGRCVVAVSEGIRDETGKLLGESGEVDSHGNAQLSGSGFLGDRLAGELRGALGKGARVRADTLGYLQRSFPGLRSEVDADEARRVGEFAVATAVSGAHDSGSIALRRISAAPYASECFVTPLETVAKHTRSFPREWITPEGNDVTAEWLAYVRPLVGELPIVGRLGVAHASDHKRS